MFGEFYKTSKLLEQEMREADHDISPVNVLTVKKKKIWKIARKLWLSLTSITSQRFQSVCFVAFIAKFE